MIHYQGLPITPETAAVVALTAGHGFPSFAEPRNMGLVARVCQSFACDNGAFGAWKKGNPITNWKPFYDWASESASLPGCDFVVIPDVIDGDEAANDKLLKAWPFGPYLGAPVWHMHESLERLHRLANEWPRICLGSSGEYAKLKTASWWRRIGEAMRVVCRADGVPTVRMHGLRMLDPAVFTRLPLASADSTNIGRNIGIDQRWKGTYSPPTKEARALVMRQRIEAYNSPSAFDFEAHYKLQIELEN